MMINDPAESVCAECAQPFDKSAHSIGADRVLCTGCFRGWLLGDAPAARENRPQREIAMAELSA